MPSLSSDLGVMEVPEGAPSAEVSPLSRRVKRDLVQAGVEPERLLGAAVPGAAKGVGYLDIFLQ